MGPQYFNPAAVLQGLGGLSIGQFQALTIIHETLHMWPQGLPANDQALAAQLGATGLGRTLNLVGASGDVVAALIKHNCF